MQYKSVHFVLLIQRYLCIFVSRTRRTAVIQVHYNHVWKEKPLDLYMCIRDLRKTFPTLTSGGFRHTKQMPGIRHMLTLYLLFSFFSLHYANYCQSKERQRSPPFHSQHQWRQDNLGTSNQVSRTTESAPLFRVDSNWLDAYRISPIGNLLLRLFAISKVYTSDVDNQTTTDESEILAWTWTHDNWQGNLHEETMSIDKWGNQIHLRSNTSIYESTLRYPTKSFCGNNKWWSWPIRYHFDSSRPINRTRMRECNPGYDYHSLLKHISNSKHL